jgi:glutamate-1-semialdehyde 2,1-aminomutase
VSDITMDDVSVSSDLALLARARAVTPNASQTKSKAPGHVGPRDCRAGFPLFALGGTGPYLVTEDNQYLDFAGANAAIPLGYGYPPVVQAVQAAIGNGSLLSVPSRLEVEVSEQLCLTVGAERVRWVRTGSEAVTAAVKMARAVTGASAVIMARHSYHGWHDWTLARFGAGGELLHRSFANGVPSVLRATVFTYDYERESPMAAVDRAHAVGHQRVAAIVIEPHRFLQKQHLRLRATRAAADACGAVLIFDEMVYGFRWATAGGQEFFDVADCPDLSCYGKALGNGVPIACVAGKAAIMDADGELITSTYGTDKLGLAAAGAVLRVHARERGLAALWDAGREFWRYFGEMYQAPAEQRLEGFPVHWRVRWKSPDEADAVLTGCAEHGVLFHRDANNASLAMSEAEIRRGAAVLAVELLRADSGEISPHCTVLQSAAK